jgi:hypothetical protein
VKRQQKSRPVIAMRKMRHKLKGLVSGKILTRFRHGNGERPKRNAPRWCRTCFDEVPQQSIPPFGSLLVGYQSPEGLRFAGRVGTGFSEKPLASVDAQLQKLKRSTCPFINLPEKTRGRWGLGITPAVMKRCQWVKPVLVAPSLPSGHSMISCVSRSSSGCGVIKRSSMWCGSKEKSRFHQSPCGRSFRFPELKYGDGKNGN